MNLTTTYMGLNLKNPIVPSASPLSKSIDNIRRMEDAGAAAVVLYSLFEEQIELEAARARLLHDAGHRQLRRGADVLPQAAAITTSDPEEYLEHIRQAKAAVDIPIIASLNGVSAAAGSTTPARWSRPAPTRLS